MQSPRPNSTRDVFCGRSARDPSEKISSSSEHPALKPASRLSLTQALEAHRAEFTTTRTARVKIGTWNVAASKDTEKDIREWFVRRQDASETVSNLSLSMAESTIHETFSPSRRAFGDTQSLGAEETINANEHAEAIPCDPRAAKMDPEVDIYVLGLQEVVDINSAVEAFRPFSDASASKRFKSVLEESLPPRYQLIAEEQLIGLLLLVYAAPDIAPQIHSVVTTSVGTGFMGYLGNKGAVTARIVLGATTRLVFVNCHMSSGAGKADLERRNWDAAQISSRTRFSCGTDNAGIAQEQEEDINDAEYAFWFGDLNYRIEGIPSDEVRKILMLHTHGQFASTKSSGGKTEADAVLGAPESGSIAGSRTAGGPSGAHRPASHPHLQSPVQQWHAEDDPTSLQTTLRSLLTHDELHQQQIAGKAFHDGWKEGTITFLPTYKYDVGSFGNFDSGEKKRGPSWCDRILYRTKKDRLLYEKQTRLDQEMRGRDAQMRAQGIERAAQDERTMFEYDPDVDGDDDYEDNSVGSDDSSAADLQEAVDDTVRVEFYKSHQHVVSSDHKPLECSFIVRYDAVDMEIKSKIHENLVREIDRAENEGRPTVTMLVEGNSSDTDPDFNGVDFGPVRYDDPMIRAITIANTGHGLAQFGFVDLPYLTNNPSNSVTEPRWLFANLHDRLVWTGSEPQTMPLRESNDELVWADGVTKVLKLDPGEAVTVDLVCHVRNKTQIRLLNGGARLETVLILRVRDGRDHFLPIKASWLRSVHGTTIEHLTRVPEGGIRAFLVQDPARLSLMGQSGEIPVMWSAPREIFRLTEAIESSVERIAAEWSMLGVTADGTTGHPLALYAGWPFASESWTLDAERRRSLRVHVNEALDTDQSFDSALPPRLPLLHRVEVLAEALLDFLGNLDDGIIPNWLWAVLETNFFAKSRAKLKLATEEKRAAILEILSASQSHSISFVLITSMLARVSQEVSDSIQSAQLTSLTTVEASDSSRFKSRGKGLGDNESDALKTMIQKNLSALFSDLLVQTPQQVRKSTPGKLDHKGELVAIFLESS